MTNRDSQSITFLLKITTFLESLSGRAFFRENTRKSSPSTLVRKRDSASLLWSPSRSGDFSAIFEKIILKIPEAPSSSSTLARFCPGMSTKLARRCESLIIRVRNRQPLNDDLTIPIVRVGWNSVREKRSSFSYCPRNLRGRCKMVHGYFSLVLEREE